MLLLTQAIIFSLLYRPNNQLSGTVMIRNFEGISPTIGESSYIDDSAVVIGDVVIGDNCSVWPLTAIRGDVNIIRIGNNTNIQDGSVLHVSYANPPLTDGAELHVGDEVTVGHKVLLHGCRVGNQCLIGMGSIVMDNAVIEDQVMLGSGSLVPPGKRLESGFLYLGSPAKKIRPLTDAEKVNLVTSAAHYVSLKQRY
ncbi:MAG: carbonic anhydrase/acetyltransferase-like protein (isoleucine patch superfamily) [Urechidicola sp.]|jgi:carbonic anhydrase/acetyltransferase-like protein (isoleucine patch superfamily)